MNGWTFALTYRSHRSYPLPIIAYSWIYGPDLQITLGLPYVLINWQPDPQWRLSLRNFGINPNSSLAFGRQESLISRQKNGLHFIHATGEEWEGQLADRVEDDVYFTDGSWRISGGSTYSFNDNFSLRGEIGYESEREITEVDGWDIFDNDDETIAEIENGIFGRITAEIKFLKFFTDK